MLPEVCVSGAGEQVEDRHDDVGGEVRRAREEVECREKDRDPAPPDPRK